MKRHQPIRLASAALLASSLACQPSLRLNLGLPEVLIITALVLVLFGPLLWRLFKAFAAVRRYMDRDEERSGRKE